MDSPPLAALLSTLISQLTLLIILLFPSSPFSHSNSLSNSPSFQSLSSLIHHFETLSLSLLSLTLPHKRRKTHFSDSPSSSKLAQLVQLGRVDSPLDSFPLFFKMTPSTFEWLCGLLEPLLECRDPVNSPINLSSELRLGIGLYRLSTGSDYPEIATRFRVTESLARFCCKQLCRVLCTNFRFWVGFPDSNEFDSVSKKYEELTGLPNCCGVIGCTRFNITNIHFIAAQIVVDSSCRILSIFAGCNGNKSNFKVLKSSTLYKDIQSGKLLKSPQYLVGENGYPLLSWLMVGYDDPKPGSNEERFNDCVRLLRVSMRKTVASLKSWGVLSKNVVKEEFRNVVGYIGACSILHNALLLREDYSGLCDCDRVEDLEHDYRDRTPTEESSIEGSVVRNVLATKAKGLVGFKFK